MNLNTHELDTMQHARMRHSSNRTDDSRRCTSRYQNSLLHNIQHYRYAETMVLNLSDIKMSTSRHDPTSHSPFCEFVDMETIT